MNRELYLRRRGKVYVREGTGGATRSQIATAQKEIAALGYAFSEALTERLATLSTDHLTLWLRETMDLLKPQTGAHRSHTPLFPGFPEQVLMAQEAELYLHAVGHYLTHRQLPPSELARPALLEGRAPRVLDLGSVEEFEGLLAPLVASRTSLSVQDAEDIHWFVRQYRADVFRLLPESVPFRETRAQVGGALLKCHSYDLI